MLSPRGQSGLEAKLLASASKLWPRPRPWPETFGLGLASVCSRRTSMSRRDWPVCLPTTGHHIMIHVEVHIVTGQQVIVRRSRRTENKKLNYVVLITWDKFTSMLSIIIWYFLFITIFGLDLKKLASVSALTSKPWPRSRSRPRDFGLV